MLLHYHPTMELLSTMLLIMDTTPTTLFTITPTHTMTTTMDTGTTDMTAMLITMALTDSSMDLLKILHMTS